MEAAARWWQVQVLFDKSRPPALRVCFEQPPDAPELRFRVGLVDIVLFESVKFRSRLPDRRRLRSALQRRDVEPLRRRRARSFEDDGILDRPGA